MQKELKQVYVILPYIKTSQAVQIRGITFRSNEDISDLPPEIQLDLQKIFAMFFLKNDKRIPKFIYAYVTYDESDIENVLDAIDKAQTLIGYVYCTFSYSLENSSLYLFWKGKVLKSDIWRSHGISTYKGENISLVNIEDDEYVDAFDGIANWSERFTAIENGRIYPPKLDFWINIPQDLSMDFRYILARDHNPQNWALAQFIYGNQQTEIIDIDMEQRIFLALEWYNRSKSYYQNEHITLLYLAIAFECLLNLEPGKEVTHRFKETIMTLLGTVPRLDSWLEQFYAERSSIVHKGSSHHLKFYAADTKSLPEIRKGSKKGLKHYALTAYGTKIFQMCLTAILTGTYLAQSNKLASSLIHNQERLDKILRTLSQENRDSEKIMISVYKETIEILEDRMQFYELDPSVLLNVTILLVKNYLSTNPPLPTNLIQSMEGLIREKSDVELRFQRVAELDREMLRSKQGYGAGISITPPTDLYEVLKTFIYQVNQYRVYVFGIKPLQS